MRRVCPRSLVPNQASFRQTPGGSTIFGGSSFAGRPLHRVMRELHSVGDGGTGGCRGDDRDVQRGPSFEPPSSEVPSRSFIPESSLPGKTETIWER
jgi:hypothetical protein